MLGRPGGSVVPALGRLLARRLVAAVVVGGRFATA